jgi:ATP-binding protein involved in chromosome partitioning
MARSARYKGGAMPLDNAAALEALRKVMDPELRRDLVSLGMVKDLTVEGETVRLKVELTTPACPLKETIGRDVKAALEAAGFRRVELAWARRSAGRRASSSRSSRLA